MFFRNTSLPQSRSRRVSRSHPVKINDEYEIFDELQVYSLLENQYVCITLLYAAVFHNEVSNIIYPFFFISTF